MTAMIDATMVQGDATGAEKPARRLTVAQQLQIGREVMLARQSGISWKALAVAYDLSRTRLWMLAKQAEGACTGQDGPEKCS